MEWAGTATGPPVSNAGVFEQAGEQRNVFGDWLLRGAIGIGAVFVGWAKFAPAGEWAGIFQQIGLGQWFRYFTGVVEVLGGLLVLVPRVAVWGLALLAITMAGAALIDAFVLRVPFFFIPGAFAVGLGAFAWSRWSE